MKKPILIIVLLFACVNIGVFLGFFFSEEPRRVATNTPPDRRTACGTLCLRIAANLYGIPCDEAQALSLCPPGADGTRLRDLQKAAPKFGMKANTAKLSWQKLLNLQDVAILHVNDNHYVLANPNEQKDNAIRVYDYDVGARWYDQKSLESMWRGTSLILAKDPNFESPTLIFAPTYWIDKGDCTAENEADYFFTIKNDSAHTIELKIDAASCQCSSAMITHEKLDSGEEAILAATVKLENKRGGFRERVTLLSTCGDEKRTDSFILAGTVIRHDILSAKRIFAGTTYRGGKIKETFAVNDPGNGQLRNVEAALQYPVSWLKTDFSYEKVTGTNLQRTGKLNVRPDDWIVTLSAEIKKDAALHDFKIPMIVRTNLPVPLDTMEVSLEGKIVPAIRVEPAALIFSDQSRERPKTLYAKSLVSSLRLPEPLVHIAGNAPLQCKHKRVNDQEFSFEIRLNADGNAPSNTFTASIRLDFGDEGLIDVPVIYQTSTK